jgi:transaldolase
VIQNVRKWLDCWGYKSLIIVGSVRSVLDIQNAALAGAHIVTIPPQFLAKMVDHRYTRETVRQFVGYAEQALTQIEKMRAAGSGVDQDAHAKRMGAMSRTIQTAEKEKTE